MAAFVLRNQRNAADIHIPCYSHWGTCKERLFLILRLLTNAENSKTSSSIKGKKGSPLFPRGFVPLFWLSKALVRMTKEMMRQEFDDTVCQQCHICNVYSRQPILRHDEIRTQSASSD